MRSRFTLVVAVLLAVSIISCNYGGISLTSTPVVATVTDPIEPTPTVASLTTRDGLEVVLSSPTIRNGRAIPKYDQEAIWVDGIFVRFDYVQRIEFGLLPVDCGATSEPDCVTPVIVTLIDGSTLEGLTETSNIFWTVKGDSDLGYYETELRNVASIAFEHSSMVATVPSSPPPATNEDAVSAMVTDVSGSTIAVSDLVFYFYRKNDALIPPKITNVTYRYLPISTGFDIDLDKIERIEFVGGQYPADDWDQVTITLKDGSTIADRVRFNPLNYPEADINSFIDVEGDAALGRLDLYLQEVRTIVFRR
jgi:hypothetical protein